MWPKEKTAFLVIHGIGEQNPFETLDMFVTTFYKILKRQNNNCEIEVQHKIKPITVNNRIDWMENYISLRKKDQPEQPIDFYEYYWAHRMEEKITFSEIIDWLIKTSDGARKFYKDNEAIVKEYEKKKDDAFKNGKFKKRWYLKHLGWFFRLLSVLQIPKIPYADPIIKFFFRKTKKLLIDYMGDVAIYTTTDVKSKHYLIRKLILEDSVKKAMTLIADENYEKIIIAGHSLGSVIAFDTLNRIDHLMNVNREEQKLSKKIKGLVTFGSPLDKIAFFFREHTPDEQSIRRQILAHFHGFKGRDLSLKEDAIKVQNTLQQYLNHVKWINFWDKNDPVSGHLDFYKDVLNKEINMKKPFGIAHTKYWDSENMYEEICDLYFG